MYTWRLYLSTAYPEALSPSGDYSIDYTDRFFNVQNNQIEKIFLYVFHNVEGKVYKRIACLLCILLYVT